MKPREFWIQFGPPDMICETEEERDYVLRHTHYKKTSPMIHVQEVTSDESDELSRLRAALEEIATGNGGRVERQFSFVLAEEIAKEVLRKRI